VTHLRCRATTRLLAAALASGRLRPRAAGFASLAVVVAGIAALFVGLSSEQGKVVLLDGGHATIELIDARQAALIDQIEVGKRVASPVRIALRAEDSSALASGLERAGAERLSELVETLWGDRNVRLLAPGGMQLTLFTPL